MTRRRLLQQMAWLTLAVLLLDACAGAPVAPAPPLPTPLPKATLTPIASTPRVLLYDELIHLFDYDPRAPLGFEETDVKSQDNVSIHRITYASPRGGKVSGYLVLPLGKGPFPAVLFMHGIGSPPDQFLSEATALAQQGIAGLLIAAPYTRRSGRQLQLTPKDLNEFVQCVTDLRRGIDLLTSRPEIDPQRIGYVGHSYGAIVGGVLSGLEKRIKAYVLMTGAARWGPWLGRMGAPPAYVDMMAVTDPVHYVNHAAPAAILLQNGRLDTTFLEQDAEELYQTASSPKEIKWYEAGHDLNEQARQDRAEWLARQLEGR